MKTKRILFVCIENAGRSQMAEAYFRKHAPPEFEAHSCGTRPSNVINPTVVQVMKEVGIDIKDQKPKLLASNDLETAAKIVNMGCIDSSRCSALMVDNTIDWQIPDPKGKTIEDVRKIRDEIDSKVKKLVEYLRNHN